MGQAPRLGHTADPKPMTAGGRAEAHLSSSLLVPKRGDWNTKSPGDEVLTQCVSSTCKHPLERMRGRVSEAMSSDCHSPEHGHSFPQSDLPMAGPTQNGSPQSRHDRTQPCPEEPASPGPWDGQGGKRPWQGPTEV